MEEIYLSNSCTVATELIRTVKEATDVITLADNETFLKCIQWAFMATYLRSIFVIFVEIPFSFS